MVLSTCLLIALIAGILFIVTAITKPEKKEVSLYSHPQILVQLIGVTTLLVGIAMGIIYIAQDIAPENLQAIIILVLAGLYGSWSMTKKHFRKQLAHKTRDKHYKAS